MLGLNIGLGIGNAWRPNPSWISPGPLWQVETRAGSNRVWLGDAEYATIAAAVTASRVTFSRASQKYALTTAGTYTSFASGELAMTDAGLSLEPAATNLVIRSTDMSHADWTKTANGAVAGQADPFGGTSGYLCTESGSTADIRNAAAITVVSGQTYTCSMIVHPGNCQWIRIGANDSTAFTNRCRLWFDLTNGVIGVFATAGTGWSFVDRSILAIGGGYYLLTFAFIAGATTCYLDFSSAANSGSGTKANVGGGAGIGCTYTIAHWQLELGAVATSPIVTAGATATRAADALVIKPVAGTYSVTYSYVAASADMTTGNVVGAGGYAVTASSGWTSTYNGKQFTGITGA